MEQLKGGMYMSNENGKNPFEPTEALTEVPETVSASADDEQEAKLGLSMLAKVVLGVVVSVSLIISISCLMQFNRLEKERKALEEDLKKHNEVIGELQHIINSPEDESYIISEAKRIFGYYFPDENIYHQD